MTELAYIGFGSNLGDSVSTLQSALEQLAQHPAIRLQQCSRFYSSKPQGPQDQPDYINAVASVSTTLTAHALLHALQNIEQQHGRERLVHWGARTLDLDLLLFGEQMIDTPDLQVPHPWLCQRSFVVYPLSELAENLCLPDGRRLADCKAQLDGNDLVPLEQYAATDSET